MLLEDTLKKIRDGVSSMLICIVLRGADRFSEIWVQVRARRPPRGDMKCTSVQDIF